MNEEVIEESSCPLYIVDLMKNKLSRRSNNLLSCFYSYFEEIVVFSMRFNEFKKS